MDFRNLYAYQKSFELAMEIFEISKMFPKEEQYSLRTRFGDLQEVFVLTLRKHTGRGFTRIISSVN